MSRLRSLFVALLAVVLIVGLPRAAWADDALARERFLKAVELYDKRQYAAALDLFRAAYAEKPSPGIKQNIALSLKALGRPVEAATAFDEALDEGADTQKPATRAAIERELAELSRVVATVRFVILSAADARPLEGVQIEVTPFGSANKVTLDVAASRRPVRLEPGLYAFRAHRDDLPDPPEKRLSLLAGSPVDATFEMGVTRRDPAPATLTVTPNVPKAVVSVDGGEGRLGGWTGQLGEGPHRVVVVAPGYPATSTIVTVSSGTVVEYPVNLAPSGEVAPAPAPLRPPPPSKRRYVVPMASYDGQSFRFTSLLSPGSGGTRRQMTGATLGVRAGYRATRVFALELYGDVGRLADSYVLAPSTAESSTSVVHWQLTPALRFATMGAVRFTGATGFGVHGLVAQADLQTGAGTAAKGLTIEGSGVAASWLLDLGMQVDLAALFLEAAAFFDVHGVGTTRDNGSDQRMFLSSPGTRAGVRVGVGIPF